MQKRTEALLVPTFHFPLGVWYQLLPQSCLQPLSNCTSMHTCAFSNCWNLWPCLKVLAGPVSLLLPEQGCKCQGLSPPRISTKPTTDGYSWISAPSLLLRRQHNRQPRLVMHPGSWFHQRDWAALGHGGNLLGKTLFLGFLSFSLFYISPEVSWDSPNKLLLPKLLE